MTIIEEVIAELEAAKKKHPNWPDNVFEQLAIVGEEFGEIQQAALQAKHENGDPRAVYHEAVQLAAMSLRLLLHLGRTESKTVCYWMYDPVNIKFNTSCGRMFKISPDLNNFKHCPECGKPPRETDIQKHTVEIATE